MTPAPAADEARHARHMRELLESPKRYPRTLAQAFPDERSYCIEGPRPGFWRRLVDWLCADSPWS